MRSTSYSAASTRQTAKHCPRQQSGARVASRSTRALDASLLYAVPARPESVGGLTGEVERDDPWYHTLPLHKVADSPARHRSPRPAEEIVTPKKRARRFHRMPLNLSGEAAT